MNITYSNSIATNFGINAALIAAYMNDEIRYSGEEHHKRIWLRCSHNRLRAIFPFMGKGAVAGALKKLTKSGMLVKREYNRSRFDRTLSYAFTDYGMALMEGFDG